MIRKPELVSVADSAQKLQQEAMSEGAALLSSSNMIFGNKKCSDGDEFSLGQQAMTSLLSRFLLLISPCLL